MRRRKKIEYVCKLFGWVGPSKVYRRGNREDEFWVWAACIWLIYSFWPIILIPVIFSIYKYKTRYEACEACRGRKLIPAHSREGRKIIEDFNKQFESIRIACSIRNSHEEIDA